MILSTKKLTKAEREADLAERAVAGDDEALGALLLQYYPMMCRMSFGYAKTGDRQDAEDLANECFAVLMRRRLTAFDKTKASFCTWIHRHIRAIVAKAAVETYSVGKMKLNRAIVFSQAGEESRDEMEMLIEQRQDIFLTASIEQLCCRLEPRRARVLKMIADGHTLADVAAELGITRQRAQQLKVSAIEELREVYAGCESVEDLPEIPMKKVVLVPAG